MEYSNLKLFCQKNTLFDISNINLNNNLGTATLTHNSSIFKIIWSITNYPAENSIPGSKYPIIVSYSIYSNTNNSNDLSLKSINGQFIYELNSGTLPNYSLMNIPYGMYQSVATNNKCECHNYLLFNITPNSITILIS